MTNYLNPALRRALILPADTHKNSSDISVILLNVHRPDFYCLLVVKLYTIFFWIPAAECMILNLKVKKKVWVSNALLTTLLWNLRNPNTANQQTDQIKTKLNDPNTKQKQRIFPELILVFPPDLFFPKRGVCKICGVRWVLLLSAAPGDPGAAHWCCLQPFPRLPGGDRV